MIKYGKLTNIDAAKMLGRVFFPDDEITSPWMPFIAATHTAYIFPAIDSPVATYVDEELESGVILGSYYNETDGPSGPTGRNYTRIVFPDGSKIEQDSTAKTLTITGVGANALTEIIAGTMVARFGAQKIQLERNGDSLKAIISDLITQLEVLTVVCAAPGSPSTVPVNFAALTAIKTRANLFFGT
jgi:phage baseplate assembly protein gpV